MTLKELDSYFNSFLNKEDFDSDVSLNGIQVSNSDPDSKIIKKVAFAVDACEQTICECIKAGAQMLFVHHGIFWGYCETITGAHYKRIANLIKNDIALYASHIPLDANHIVGNNYGLAERLNLKNKVPAGVWHGMTFGVMGTLPRPQLLEELVPQLFPDGEKPLHILPFGKEKIESVMILSGGTGDDINQAVAAGVDLFICGELGHEQYHYAKEHSINVLAGGHYNTETVGVRLVAQKLAAEKGIESVFIDVPTGL